MGTESGSALSCEVTPHDGSQSGATALATTTITECDYDGVYDLGMAFLEP